jgi:hypothetical protein
MDADKTKKLFLLLLVEELLNRIDFLAHHNFLLGIIK